MKSRLYSNYDKLFGGVYWTEFLGVLSLTIPLAAVHLLKFLPAEISAAFGGRLSENELAATVLANTYYLMSAVTIVIGATSALNTLVAQSYGSGDLPAVRAHLSRLAFICTVLFFGLLVPLMLHAELILVVVLRQNAEVSRLAGRFLLLSLPALFARFVHTFLMRFFQSLDVTAPAIISAVWGVVLDLALNLLFFLVLQWQSLDAIAVAFSIAHSITAIIAVWLSWRHEIVRTVGLWPLAISRRELLSRWGEFIGLAVPSVFQTLAWVSAVEFTILLAGLHKTLSQDAFGVLHFLAAIGGSLAGGLEGATCTRVGQHVGASDWRLVRVASNASLLLSLIGGLLLGTSCLVLGEPMLHLFTNQKPVIKLAASMLNYVVALGVLATLLSAAFGALRGLGSYWIPTVICVVCFYMFGVPASITLMFHTRLELNGIWVGVLIAVALQLVLYLLFFYLYELPRCEREADSPSDAAPAPQAHALSVSVGTQKSPELSSSSESEVGSDDQVARPLHKKNSVGFGFGSSERGEDEIRLFGSVALNGDRGATERSPILSKKPETKKEKERVSEEKEQLVASPTSEESLMLPKERTEKQNIGEIEKEEKTTCGGGTGLPRCMIISSVFLLLFSIVLRIFQDSYLKPPNNKQ